MPRPAETHKCLLFFPVSTTAWYRPVSPCYAIRVPRRCPVLTSRVEHGASFHIVQAPVLVLTRLPGPSPPGPGCVSAPPGNRAGGPPSHPSCVSHPSIGNSPLEELATSAGVEPGVGTSRAPIDKSNSA